MSGPGVNHQSESTPQRGYEEKYAIFIPESTGFLHCRYLSLGSEGSAHIVRSIVDNHDYVRKKMKPTYGTARHKNDGIRNPEVALYRPHPNIPRLLGSGNYAVLPENHPRYGEFQTSFMIFSLSDGGTLLRLFHILERERILAPEALVLQILDHLMGAIIFLHNGTPGYCGITHRDVHEDNVFLHFPTEESKLPEIMLGDLGAARAISENVWEPSVQAGARRLKHWTTFEQEIEVYNAKRAAGIATNEQDPVELRQQARDIYWDLQSVRDFIIRAFEGKHQPANRPRVGTPVHPETHQVITQFLQAIAAEDYNAAVAVYPAIHNLAERSRTNPRQHLLPNFQWTRQDRYRDDLPPGQPSMQTYPWPRYNTHLDNEPEALAILQQPFGRGWRYTGTKPQIQLFNSRLDLLRSTPEVPGPWRIARICAKTLKIKAVEYFTYNFRVPTVEDLWSDGQAPNPHNFDFEEHRDMQRYFVKYGSDNIGMETVLKQMEWLERSQGLAPDHYNLLQLDPKWCGENGGLSKQVRLALVAGSVAAEARTAASPVPSRTDATTPIGSPTHSTGNAPTEPTNATPIGSPAYSTGNTPSDPTKTTPPGSPAHSTGNPPLEPTNTTPPGSPAPSTGVPPAPTTATALAGNSAPPVRQPPRRRRQRREYGRPNVETRAMAAAKKRNTRSVTRAGIQKAKKRC
ncbi:hypothetical protein H2200_000366 [Cladophialophora chaetospira]|uniref:Protein kinase domain-containing protein n=1 Tax=Cladophialophora chaetospira TaxID=386627 RepID=A0AA39CQ95_9EURO|nr:hypothetical protein H2200_000366 [Cladophialophora chaetospira]